MNLYNLKLVCHLLASSIIPVVFTRERLSVEAISQSFNCWNQTIACPTYSCAFIHSKPRLNKRHAGLWSILLNRLNYPLVIQLDNRRSNATNKSIGKTILGISAYFCSSFPTEVTFLFSVWSFRRWGGIAGLQSWGMSWGWRASQCRCCIIRFYYVEDDLLINKNKHIYMYIYYELYAVLCYGIITHINIYIYILYIFMYIIFVVCICGVSAFVIYGLGMGDTHRLLLTGLHFQGEGSADWDR